MLTRNRSLHIVCCVAILSTSHAARGDSIGPVIMLDQLASDPRLTRSVEDGPTSTAASVTPLAANPAGATDSFARILELLPLAVTREQVDRLVTSALSLPLNLEQYIQLAEAGLSLPQRHRVVEHALATARTLDDFCRLAVMTRDPALLSRIIACGWRMVRTIEDVVRLARRAGTRNDRYTHFIAGIPLARNVDEILELASEVDVSESNPESGLAVRDEIALSGVRFVRNREDLSAVRRLQGAAGTRRGRARIFDAFLSLFDPKSHHDSSPEPTSFSHRQIGTLVARPRQRNAQ